MDRDRGAVTPIARPWWLSPALALVPVAFLITFYAWPVLTLFTEVADASAISDTFRRPGLGRVIWFTCWQAVVSTLATLAIGLLPTYLVSRWQFPGRRLVMTLVTVPFLLPTVVVGAAFASLLPDRLRGTATAVIAAHVFFNIAVVVRIVGTVWSQLPRDMVAAARTLGAGPWRATRLVTLPLLRPSIIAAGTITFLFTFTSFGVVQVLGGPANPTIEVEIARRATQLGDVRGAAVLSALQLVILVVLVAITARAQRSTTELALGRVARRRPDVRRTRIAVYAGLVATLGLMALPLAALVTGSLRPGGQWSLSAWRSLGDREVRPGLGLSVDPVAAIAVSLRHAVVATGISLVVGTLATLAIATARRRGQWMDVGMMLPLGTSAVTIGFGMLITFDRAPFDWRAQPWLVPLGHALVASPFVVRTMLPVLRSRPTGWIDAAGTLGASPLQAWWHIDVARLRRPLVISAGFAAAISLGEFGATTFLTRTGDETLPVAIARLLGRAGDIPHAQGNALAVVLAAMTLVILVAVDLVDRDPSDRQASTLRLTEGSNARARPH
jgi:thiamine transport system permease protein